MTSRYEELESYLLEFVKRVSEAGDGTNKSPEEVAVLPEMTKLLLSLLDKERDQRIRNVLETALHELTVVNDLRVTDIPAAPTEWVIDTKGTTSLIEETLDWLRESSCLDI